ncbi:disease resistance protein RUN1-like isoform X2 [Vicia villosa]|uniref:disease resistance protein RUN1-like isoform X2 n=1 Tax=Vicia villosa TaxID=3911 RepID=UPI00273C28D6|nr:disease resistance protein RUN1-like isoform X2 [Vicia villosa]
MASTSNSNSSSLVTFPRRNYYDVFVSFRGEDTRCNFADHLFAAFQRKGIFAFRDDTKLKKGESIAPELFRAIQDSQIFVVIFSKNYASSTWCLRELEHILLQCGQLPEKRVLPVFYDVDPSEVRHQKGTYGEALAKHEQRFQQDPEKVRRWTEALSQVTDLSGWDVCHKPQHAEIEKIVEEIISILGCKFSSLPKDLVGMHSPIHELEKHLLLDSLDDVRVVGICGMGGIGKTTLATTLYNKISHQFHLCCIIDDLSKRYRQDGPISAQKQILLQIVGEEQLQTCTSYNTYNLIRSRLHRVKALIILDNVDQVEQLEKLSVSREWLGEGSRVIVISRDEHILKEYGVDVVYKVPLLNENNSLQLFSRKAFKLDHIVNSYDKLAFDILHYANGLPLAIKVLGSFLFGRSISEWKSALARLRKSPNKDIMDVLRLSFDGLEKTEKEIFLHIACFFHSRNEKYVTNVLNCCGFHVDIGLRVLIDKSLISLSGKNCIEMHSLLEELGKKIVQEKSSKWSRVWREKQFYNIKLENMEKKVEAICSPGTYHLMANMLSKMIHLRLLILNGVNSTENLTSLTNELRYVEWDKYPFKYLPSIFQPNQLVELILRYSNIKQLCEDNKYFSKLRSLDLSYSKNLIKMPDFRDIPHLEQLSFEGCVKLVKMDPSIGVLKKVVFLNLKDCKNLVSISNNIFSLNSLEYVNLSGCPKVFKNQGLFNISGNASHSQSTTSSILKWTAFRYRSLYSRAHKDLASCLLPFLSSFSNLLELDISFCGLSQLPDAIGCLRWLEELELGGNNFVTLPSLKELCRLAYLNLQHCKLLEYLPELPFPTAIDQEFRKNKYMNKKGLVIFNCPKLNERELGSTINFSWMKQFIQANQVLTSIYNEIDFVIPGSEIPSWCNNQSEGRSIRIDLSPIMSGNDNNCSGIACCAIFSFSTVVPTMTSYAQCSDMELVLSNSVFNGKTIRMIPIILERDLIEIESDHMCLIYFPLKTFFYYLKIMDKTLGHQDQFKVYFRIGNHKCMGWKVQKCGYHWVCKQEHASLPKLLSSEVQVFGN